MELEVDQGISNESQSSQDFDSNDKVHEKQNNLNQDIEPLSETQNESLHVGAAETAQQLSQSIDSDSNLRTETTTESNSIEFSQDLLHDEVNENNLDVCETEMETTGQQDENAITMNSCEKITDKTEQNFNSVEQKEETNDNATDNKKQEKEGPVESKAIPPPSKAKPRSGKMVFCKVHLLDGQLYETDVTKNATGKELFDKVCQYLTLQEKEYFGLQYVNNNVKFWMNNDKKILKQVKGGTCVFDFSVKFYPPEPTAMLEDISRFQLCLQVRFDIFNGKLPCSFTTLAVLGSYMVQAEVGDYDHIDEYEFGPGDSYLDKIEYAPDKSPEMRSKVHELHRTHKGLTPEDAELQYLQNAKKLAMYGVDLHQTRDSQGVRVNLGVCASGIQVYKDKLRINRFVWPAILKLSYKRNSFYVKKRPEEGQKDGETISFKLDNHKMAKRLWKTCVEHHAFFRLHEADPPKSSTFPRFNSRFRYSGRTQKQVRDDVEKVENRPKFDRTHFKYSSMPQSNHTDGFPDERDRTDQKGVTTPSTESGPPPYFNQDTDGYNKMESSTDKPNHDGEDRRDRIPAEGEAVEDLYPGAGDAATLEANRKDKKSKEDKEREKREKEEEKRRKKEEEKERKRLEKEKKLGKGSEDRTDKMGDDLATAGYNGDHTPGSTNLDSGKITTPLPPDGADSTQEIKQPVETAIDEKNNNWSGIAGAGLTGPNQSEGKDKQRPVTSPETDIDGTGSFDRDDDGRKSDKDGKKKDKSKRKESDKSKDKKSGFFGRLKSPKDKKGKGMDSPPASPTSPGGFDKKVVTITETTTVEEKRDSKETPSQENPGVVIEIVAKTKGTVDGSHSEQKEMKEVVISSETKEKEVEKSDTVESKNVINENITTNMNGNEQHVITKQEVIEVNNKEVDDKQEVVNTDTIEVTTVTNTECGVKNEEETSITIIKPEEKEVKIETKTLEEKIVVQPLKTDDNQENLQEQPIEVDNSKEEKDKMSVVEKIDQVPIVCNHVHSDTGSLSSDSSDDEEVCGDYHVESPTDKVKVETIMEEHEEITQNDKDSKVEDVNATDELKMEENKTIVTEVVEEVVEKVEEKKIETPVEVATAEPVVNEDKKDVEQVEKTEVSNEVQVVENEVSQVKEEQNTGQGAHHERNVDEKRDFDVVVSEQKVVSPDGSQVINVRSEKRTETIQKEVLTHTRRELKPEEYQKYQKEIQAADERNRLALQSKTGDVKDGVVETVQVVEITHEENTKREEVENSITSGTQDEKEKVEALEEGKQRESSESRSEEGVVEVKIVKSDNDLEKNVEKMKYIDEDSSGDQSKAEEVVISVVNEEAGNNEGAAKLDKKESIRLKKEEKERKKKELAEEKERKKKEKEAEKERIKKEKQEEKDRKKKAKEEEKERKRKEKEAEKERKRKEKEEKKSKKTNDVEEKVEEVKNVDEVEKVEDKKTEAAPSEEVEERVPTAIAMVMAKQKEEEKMEEIDLKDEQVEPEKQEVQAEVQEDNKKKHKNSKKEKKEKEKQDKLEKKKKDKQEKEEKSSKKKKKPKSSSCFSAAVESSDEEEKEVKEEEKPQEEVKEEIVQEEVKPVQEEAKKGKGLGWALPGMDELQKKGTKHEEKQTQEKEQKDKVQDQDIEIKVQDQAVEIKDNEVKEEVKSSESVESSKENAQSDEIQEIIEKTTEAPTEAIIKTVEDSVSSVKEEENTIKEKSNEEPGTEVGVGAGGDMINRVLPEGEGSIDRRMQFMPVTPPVKETKDSLKGTDRTMPFFDPSSEDSLKKKGPPVPPKGMRNGYSDEDRRSDMPPTIPTESFTYQNNVDDTPISTKNVPYVKTKTQTVTYEKDGYPYESEDGILISSQSHSTRTQTIETTTYKTEKDGKVETRVEKKVVITDEGDDDDLDHDDLLAEAIRSVTEMNPDLSVERIECMRQIEEVEK